MRFLPSSLVFAFVVSSSVIPAADARTWSPLGASLTRYDIRAAVKAKKTTAKKRPASVELPAIAKGGLLFGDKEAATTIVMFTDIECPFCQRFHQMTYPDLKKDFIDTKKVRFVIRHFPLSFHRDALNAAKAVVCARSQGDEAARGIT